MLESIIELIKPYAVEIIAGLVLLLIPSPIAKFKKVLIFIRDVLNKIIGKTK